ncbi:kinase-like domain-containing protein [Boletus edulis]|nr:kinase-like domain-containing protein [Boletus edulis]
MATIGEREHNVQRQDKARSGQMNIGSNTPFRRVTLIAAIRAARYLRPQHGNVLFLTGKLCVKYGSLVQLSEAFALQFVAAHTSIPVPKVHCAFVQDGCTYILMDRIKGDMLVRGWASRTDESKANIFGQLRKMVDEMRKLPAPGHCISNVVGGSLYDSRFAGTSSTIGPFDTIQDFHLFLRNGMKEPPENYPEVGDLMRLQDQPWPMPVFTHADLSSFNILVRGDDVVGIIDWETAGWYPIYWEYTMACLEANPMNMWWKEEADHYLEPMQREVEMEALRLKYFGRFPWFQ